MMKPRITEYLEKEILRIIDEAISVLDTRDLARENIIKISRDLIRCSGRVVSLLLAEERYKAENELRSCETLARELLKHLNEAPDLVRGLGSQALAEYCEALLLSKIFIETTLECDDNIPKESVLSGILDLTGELKRIAIRLLGEWDLEKVREIIDLMKKIYLKLSPLDYPDALVPGYRHKIDVLRRNIEDLETLYVDVKTRRELINRLSESS